MLNELFGAGEFKLNVRKIQEQLVREALRIHIASIDGRIEACMRCPIVCSNPPGFKPAPTYREVDDDSPERLGQIPQLAPFAKIPFYPSVSERFGFGGTTKAKDLVAIAKKELQEIEDRIQDKERELNAIHKSNVHQINEGRKELGRLRDDFRRKEREAEARLEGMGGAYAQMEDTARQLAATEESLRRVTGEHGDAVRERDQARTDREEARGALVVAETEAGEARGAQEVAETRAGEAFAAREAAVSEAGEAGAAREVAERERDTAVTDLATQKAEHDTVLEKFKTTRTTIEAELEEAKKKGENVEELERELRELKLKIQNGETKQQELQAALDARTRDVARVEQERDALRPPVLTLGVTEPQHVAIAPQAQLLGVTAQPPIAIAPQPQLLGVTAQPPIAIAPQPGLPGPAVPVPLTVVPGPTAVVQPSEAEVKTGTAVAGPQGRFEETSASVPDEIIQKPTEPPAKDEKPEPEEPIEEKEAEPKPEVTKEPAEVGPSEPSGKEEAEPAAPWDMGKLSVQQLAAKLGVAKISTRFSAAKVLKVSGAKRGRAANPKSQIINANMPVNMVEKYWLALEDEEAEAANVKETIAEMQGMLRPIQSKDYVLDLVSCLVFLGYQSITINHKGDRRQHPLFDSNATTRRTLTRIVTDYMAHYYEHPNMWEVTPVVVQSVLQDWWEKIMDKHADMETETAYWKWGVERATALMAQLEQQQFVVQPGERPKLDDPFSLDERGMALFENLDKVEAVKNRQLGEHPNKDPRHVKGMRGVVPGGVPVEALVGTITKGQTPPRRPKAKRRVVPAQVPGQQQIDVTGRSMSVTPGPRPTRPRTRSRTRSRSVR